MQGVKVGKERYRGIGMDKGVQGCNCKGRT